MKFPYRCLLVVGALMTGSLLLGACDEEEQEGTATTPSGSPEAVEESPAPAEQKVERIVQAAPGAVAEAHQVRVTLNEIIDPWVDPSEFQEPGPGRRYVAFDVTIEKVKGGTHSAKVFGFKLTDAEGFAYEPALLFALKPHLSNTEIGAGEKIRGRIGFLVNEGTPLSLLKYDPDPWTGTDVEFHWEY